MRNWRIVTLVAALLAGGLAFVVLKVCESKEAACSPDQEELGVAARNPLQAPEPVAGSATRQQELGQTATSPLVFNARSAQTRVATTQHSERGPAHPQVSWKDIREKNYERIVNQYAGDSPLADRQRYAIYKAVDEFNSLYIAMYQALHGQMDAAARDIVTKRGSKLVVLPGDRFVTVGVTNGGLHCEVRVYESEYPHVFVTRDDLDQVPVRLHARITAILSARH